MRIAVSILLVSGLAVAQAGDLAGGERLRIEQGLKMAPVSLRYNAEQRDLVGLGSYLLNAIGACAECHSPEFNPYAAGGNPGLGEPEKIDPARYLIGGAEMEGFISRNLRPDSKGRPAGLTFEQFLEVMRTGKDFKPELGPPDTPILKVMPWTFYAHMSEYDLRAIYEYLKVLPRLGTVPAGTTTQVKSDDN